MGRNPGVSMKNDYILGTKSLIGIILIILLLVLLTAWIADKSFKHTTETQSKKEIVA